MTKKSIQAYFFVLVVVQKGEQFLVIRERKHNQLWYLPAGRVEAGESFQEAAKRETLEEAGINIDLEGIIRIEHTAYADYARVRLVFLAKAQDNQILKSKPDEHTLEARWCTIKEVQNLPTRGSEFISYFFYVQNGGLIAPMTMLARENAPMDIPKSKD